MKSFILIAIAAAICSSVQVFRVPRRTIQNDTIYFLRDHSNLDFFLWQSFMIPSIVKIALTSVAQIGTVVCFML